ncbi:hypothetical protein DFQ28_000714 [Apophysomyces sp. BC1034]|nr:hypothetical protein DFQ30_000537 [Apophysomyces sp. BC1015]KAG0180801.1 hypothetical protein DFQ29_010121 [Apophysomyces sp. BC1021]KAG0191221.1 hypothetical protein DFQ28_000714 [Apophysomyces sp. BC1034]
MSVNRYRDRKYNSSDNDRLLRALSQPVQAWEKKWIPHSHAKNFQTYKWVKSDRPIVFEDDDDDEGDEHMTEAEKDVSETVAIAASEPMTIDNNPTALAPTAPTDNNVEGIGRDVEIKGTIATLAAEDEECTHTPKLEEISDVEPENNTDKDDEESNGDDVNDPARHPASIPHVHPRLTDDEAMDSIDVTPRTEEGDLMMPESVPSYNDDSQQIVLDETSAGFAPNESILSSEHPNV